ncbi:MAG: inositol monophosphatase [Clostridia bacterium]|nr:inositol monophosphatase [Clostridia bacterium]
METLTYRKKLLAFIIKLVKKAGKIVVNANTDLSIDEKLNFKDLVTQYDKAVQDYLENSLSKKYPFVKFLAEEGDDFGKVDLSGELFIIDPIDGTSNFINKLNASAISVAYAVDGETVVGVVYNPFNKDLFYAIKGFGAFYNGKKTVVNERSIKEGLVGFGTAVYYDELIEKTKQTFSKVLVNCNDMRRLGGASLDICYVATNKFSAFYECRLAPWDYASAMLILKESGGIITDFDGNELTFDKKTSVVTGNQKSYYELKKLLDD